MLIPWATSLRCLLKGSCLTIIGFVFFYVNPHTVKSAHLMCTNNLFSYIHDVAQLSPLPYFQNVPITPKETCTHWQLPIPLSPGNY